METEAMGSETRWGPSIPECDGYEKDIKGINPE